MAKVVNILNETFDEILKEREDVYILGEDICDPYGGAFKVTKGLSSKYPERVLNTPISEGAIVGLAVGMALEGFRPVVEIMFGDFITLAMDQLVTNVSKLPWLCGDDKLPIVVRTPMGGRRGYGATHSQSLEKLLFGIPGIEVVALSYIHNIKDLLWKMILSDSPVFCVENKLDYTREIKEIKEERLDFWHVKSTLAYYTTISLSATQFEEDRVTIITYGGMLHYVETAAKRLTYEEEITSEIVVPSLLKPLNMEPILDSVNRTGRVIVVEEGTLTNGWGAEVIARILESNPKINLSCFKRISADDLPIASSRNIEDEVLPSESDIINGIRWAAQC